MDGSVDDSERKERCMIRPRTYNVTSSIDYIDLPRNDRMVLCGRVVLDHYTELAILGASILCILHDMGHWTVTCGKFD